jgi:cytochrome P450
MDEFNYNPYAPEVQFNPYPLWQRLRDEEPVHHNTELNFYALSRYDDVLAAFLDAPTFISGMGVTIDGSNKGSGFLNAMDAPEHTIYRKLLSRVFTPRRVGELEPFIRGVAADYLDKVRDQDRFDLVQDFTLRLPMDVIGELLGIPAELRERVHELSDRATARDANAVGAAASASEDAIAAMVEMRTLFAELVADRRKQPRDDIISMLLTSEVTDDDGNVHPIADQMVAAQFHLLSAAGHETIMKAIANGMVALAWYPDQRAELVEHPDLIPGAVEETLRWDNPAPLEGRWSTRDVELHGTTIPKDSRVLLVMGAANHDDRRYEEPELFDIHRDIVRPVVFGFGAHLCLGAALARLEMKVAFEEILARFPDYEIDESGIVRGPASVFRGLNNLPIIPHR